MISQLIKIVLISSIVFPELCAGRANVCLDLNDILSLNWMPATLLQKVGADVYDTDVANKTFNGIDNRMEVMDGTIDDALTTMTFHRSMLNQYHCTKYVANQIVSEMSKTAFERRSGGSDPENVENDVTHKDKIKSSLLSDQGSSSYEDWLRKSATLDDLYRHHHSINNLMDTDLQSAKDNAVNTDKNQQISTKFDHQYHGDYIATHGAFLQPTIYHTSEVEQSYSKSDKIADIFEIALTALAYLSFGMFIVHLMMCISAVSNQQTTTANTRIVALNLSPAEINADEYEPHGTVTDSMESDEFKFRSIKEPNNSTPSTSETPNELARKILSIFDSALGAPKDKGQCFRYALCNATKYSRFINGKGKLFMGWWSFGVSWLSEKLTHNFVSKLEGLQAIIFGLGKANCKSVYPCMFVKDKQ
ncbi:hypothetical protein HUJ04_003816 [Dendroctonus ponderosae]|uniref:Uncharacterized protein n=2 Tax=Dendroctonus ponderosae TaxID=77166 RepID=A0AAR5P3Z5_DENPD|nr:hypothetical protein HUJ04_003816 [Dendroctonus ponderosae]